MMNLSVADVRAPQAPDRRVDVVLDTDTYNEIDDQFALAYLLRSPERANTVGITIAPFFNKKSSSPADGMEKSYAEALKILGLMGREDMIPHVYRGSDRYLPNGNTPVPSAAATYLVAEAERHSPENPLYVVAIGAITNVASAILLNRGAMERNAVVVWLGGHRLDWPDTKEFNMKQDIPAAQVVFDSAVPLVQLPCAGVVSEFSTTEWELRAWLQGKNPLADYLCQNTIRYVEAYGKGTAWSKCIWDVTAVAWLLNENSRFLLTREIPAPRPELDGSYSFPTEGRKPITYVFGVKRVPLFTDLFRKLTEEIP